MLVVHLLLPRFLVLEVLGLLLLQTLHEVRGCRDGDSGCDGVCQVEVAKTRHLPLIFSSSGKLIFPHIANGKKSPRELHVQLPTNATATCPGAKLSAVDASYADVKCSGLGGFEVAGTLTDSISCSSSIEETVRKSGVQCGPVNGNGVLAHIGWERPDSKSFLAQITVCYDDRAAVTFYTNHSLNGEAIEARETQAVRPPNFKQGGFFRGLKVDSAYKTKSQKKFVSSLVGSEASSQIFHGKTSYLARGHLSPDADFVFQEWQDATYYFVNAAPQWQSFNNGNWRAVEESVREYAAKTRSTLSIFTGTLGQLRLKNLDSREVPIFLARKGDENFLPVPQYFWKLVHNAATNEAVAFVGVNGPPAEGMSAPTEEVCSDKCASAGWRFKNQVSPSRGRLFCCSYDEFGGLVGWIPDIEMPNLLRNM
jgi:hypothetical protein